MPEYVFTMKSMEQKGAGDPNTLRVGLASDDDAATFAGNLNQIVSGLVVSVDKIISEDYSLPYPAGTDRQFRGQMLTPPTVKKQAQIRVQNVKTTVNPYTLAADLVAAGIKLPLDADVPATSINFTDIKPGQSG